MGWEVKIRPLIPFDYGEKDADPARDVRRSPQRDVFCIRTQNKEGGVGGGGQSHKGIHKKKLHYAYIRTRVGGCY